MKKVIIILISILFFACAHNKNAMSINSGKYDAAFLKASYLINEGNYDEALVILNFINKEVKDEYIVLKIADLYIVKKDYSKALEVINKALQTSELKDKDILYYQKAKLLIADKKYDQAIKSLKKAIKINPEEDYLKLLASLYKDKKDFAAAIEIYTELIKKYKNSEYYHQRGKLYFQLHLEKNAVADLNKAVDIDEHTAALIDLANYYISKGNYNKAINYLKRVNDDRENVNLMAKYKLGQLYVKQRKDNEAIKLYEDIIPNITSEEQKFFILKQLATLYFERRNYEMARKYFIEAFKSNEHDIQTLYFIGISSEALKDYKTARKYYKKALSLSEGYGEVLKRLAYLDIKDRKFDSALKYIDSMLDVDKDVEYYRLKSLIYSEQKDYAKQEKVLENALKKFRNNEELMLDYAFSLESQKKYDKSIQVLKKIIEIYPENATALNFLGYLYADINRNIDEAYDLVKRALEIEPDNYAYLDSMAWVLYRQGKYKEAYEYQKKALKKNPDEKEIRDHMTAILNALGSKKTFKDVLQEN